MTERQLVLDLIKGDEDAFRQLVESYQDKVYSISFGYLRNDEDAEDITQEVFIEVFQSIKKFKAESELSTWVYRITVNKNLECIRRKKAKKRFSFLSSLFGREEMIGEKFSDFDHPGVKLENKERALLLLNHIEMLPENQRTAFQLQQLQDMSYSEIAKILNTSVSSVESLMFRARKNLKKSLSRFYKNENRL